MLVKQRRSLLDERAKNQTAAEVRRLQRLQINVDREECARRSQVLESLRTLVPRVDAARLVYSAGVERRDAISQQKRALVAGLGQVVPPSWPAFLLFVTLIWVGVGGLILADHAYFGAALGTISVVAMLWYRDRVKRAAGIEQQVTACST